MATIRAFMSLEKDRVLGASNVVAQLTRILRDGDGRS
jgi:hypothetical protein